MNIYVVFQVWRPHFFVLSNNRLDWTAEQTDSEDKEDDESCNEEEPENEGVNLKLFFSSGATFFYYRQLHVNYSEIQISTTAVWTSTPVSQIRNFRLQNCKL